MKRLLLLANLTAACLVFFALPSYGQFVEERSISPDEASIDNQMMDLSVIDAKSGNLVPADVNIYGLNPRKPVLFEAVEDTSFAISNYRLYTVSCVKEGYMYYSEKFWPEEKATHKQEVTLIPLEIGLKTDVRNIVFLGDKTEIYHKSKPALAELIRFLDINPTVRIAIIGHVNGPDNDRSKRFYQRASEDRAEAVKNYLVEEGISEDRLEVRGAGNTEMIYPDPITDWQNEANRRVEIEVIGL